MKIITRFSKLTVVMLIAYLGIAAVSSDHGKYFEISKNIEIFTNLYKEINTYYVDDIDPAKLMRTGVDAMLESLDPYTNFISESEIEGFRYITDGKYNGIGALIHRKDDMIVITEPYENCPAHKAGLKAGDIVLEIDGKNAVGKTTDDVSDILKGFPGTEIELKIKRPGVSDNMSITMTRDEVIVPNVPHSSFVTDDIGYISLTTFTRDAGKNVAEALKKLKAENPALKGVIFDLRGNGGGLLTEAVNVSNVFIPKGELVVTTKGKVIDWDRSFKTLNKPVDEEIPLVVLINKGSASASEIVSGVIQDLDRGVLIGQRSYGKGLVQNTRDVGYNSKVKMTTAKYYIPSGRCIQGVSYSDGTPIDIPDAERTAFKTRNGRTVLDGGGVKSDVPLDELAGEGIMRSLFEKHLIFDFVTEYCVGKETIPAVENFEFKDFDQFVTFLKGKDYHYETETEKLLKNLEKKADQEKLLSSVQGDITTLQNKIQQEKKNELQKNKERITDFIEKEIASRYYYQKGKIMMSLKNDIEIEEAVKVLSDNNRYQEILGKK
ncbi:MAG: S41 family peptidase [Saprospiraceae bacterium]